MKPGNKNSYNSLKSININDFDYKYYSLQVIILAVLFSLTSIISWTLVGKFLRKFATNEKFIKYFNYAMSLLLLLSIITFYF